MTNGDAPWRDEELLRQKYWDEEKSLSEVADELGCSVQTVSNWLEKYNLGTRDSPSNECADYRDADVLFDLYHNQGLSTIEVAEKLDCSKQTVQKYMKRHGIETRKSNHEKPLSLITDKAGYEYVSGYSGGDAFTIMIHRVLALANGQLTPTEFIQGEKNVHHINNIQWDNRTENLEVLTISDHAKRHDEDRDRQQGQYC